MVTFIVELAAMVSLAAVLYILISILPRINDSEIQKVTSGLSFHAVVDYLEKADELIASFFIKFLRRVRVTILKLDNTIGKKLNEFKKKEKNGNNENPFPKNEAPKEE
ncbi:MAG: hypothetical protein AAB503_02305 [Patescibacteria group bacterium]